MVSVGSNNECEFNKVNDYEGLETLFNDCLKTCHYKSDVIILFAHYILTEVKDYEFGEMIIERDSNDLEVEMFVPTEFLNKWNQHLHTYKLFYKNEDGIRILSGKKNNRDFVGYFSKENFDRNKISPQLCLKDYIPDVFLRSVDVSLLDNLSGLRRVLLDCFDSTDKVKSKRTTILDDGLDKMSLQCGPSKRARGLINEVTDFDSRRFGKKLPINQHKPDRTLQLPINKPEPIQNKINIDFINDPNFYMQEYSDGEPDESYLN